MITSFLVFGEYEASFLTILELVIGQLFFLFHLPKRKHFWLWLGLSWLVYALYVLFVPPYYGGVSSQADYTSPLVVLYCTLYWVLLFFLTFILNLLPFDTKSSIVLFYCASGYCIQHLSFSLYFIIDLLIFQTFDNQPWMDFLICAAVYALFYFFLIKRRLNADHYQFLPVSYVLLIVIVIIIVNTVLSVVFRAEENIGIIGNICRNVYSIICAFLILTLQYSLYFSNGLRYEIEMTNKIYQRDKEQYVFKKQYIEDINLKYHDLKHLANSFDEQGNRKGLDDLKRSLSDYDSFIETGNEALNVVVNEKTAYCTKNGIALTCLLNGEDYAFMDDIDIYSLIGNALENAIEAVENLNGEKRAINLTSKKQNDLLLLHIENYCNHGVSLVNGFPKTTKSDEKDHGFGIKSMKKIVEKYQGTMTFSSNGSVFMLDIIFLSPKKTA